MATKKYLDTQGTKQIIDWIKSKFIQIQDGKTLSDVNFTADYKEALDNLPTTYVSKTDHASDLVKKVDKEDGKGLSTNDFTTAEKQKLNVIESGAEVNAIETIKRNGTVVNPVSKVVDINVPTKVSELTNDSKFMTSDQVTAAINNANHMSKEIVSSLPGTGKDMVIYLVKDGTVEGNAYAEYLWVNGAWEKIGDTATEIDLSGYVASKDLVPITSSEISSMFANA